MKLAFLLSCLFISVIAQSTNRTAVRLTANNQPGNQIGNRTTNNIRSNTSTFAPQNYRLSTELTNELPPGIPTLTINIFSNFTLPPPLTLNQTIIQINEQYPPIDQSYTVRDNLPRFYGPEFQLDYNDPVPKSVNQSRNQGSNDSMGDWVKGTIFYVIPGAACAVIALIAWIALIVKHCCFSSKHDSVNQSISHPTVYLTVLIFCSLVIFVFSCIGLAYNVQLSHGLTNGEASTSVNDRPINQPTGLITNLSVITWDESDSSLGVVTAADKSVQDLLMFTTQFHQLVNRLIDVLDYTVPRINNQLVDASAVIGQFDQLMRQFITINQAIDQFSIGNFSCSSSPTCAMINQPITRLMNSVADVVFPVLSVIDNDVQSIQTNLVAVNQSIHAQLVDAMSQIDDVTSQVTDLQPDIETVSSNVRKYDKLRFGLTCTFFALPIVFLIVSLIICLIKYCKHSDDDDRSLDPSVNQSSKPLLRRSLLLRIIIHLFCFLSIISWLIFGTHLAVTSAIADTCIFADSYQVSIHEEFDDTVANVVHACLLNTSLITALNIADSINFAVDVVIPNVTSINQIFPVDQLTSAINQTDILNLDSFGYSPSDQTRYRTEALNQVNQITTPVQYTVNNINQLDPNSYPANQRNALNTLKQGILLSLDAERSINAFLTGFRQNLSTSLTLVQNIQQTSDSILTSFLSVGETVAPLINAGQTVVSSAYCGVLGQNVGAAKHSYCQDVLQAVGLIDLSSFIIALMCLPLIGCLCLFESWSTHHPHAHIAWKSPPQTPIAQSVNMGMYPVVSSAPTNNYHRSAQNYQSTGQTPYLPAVPPRPSAPAYAPSYAPGGYVGEPQTV